MIRVLNDARAVTHSMNDSAQGHSFNVMNDFRKWAQKVGMVKQQCEAHIDRYRGMGLDSMKAGLAMVQKFHK